jgi:hypothetical protein
MIKEIQGYLTTLRELQDQVKNLLEGLPQEALDWRPIQEEGELETNSLAAIVTHLAGSEIFFMKEIIGRQPIQRDREAEFVTRGMNASVLKAKVDAAAKSAEEVLSPFDRGPTGGRTQVSGSHGNGPVVDPACHRTYGPACRTYAAHPSALAGQIQEINIPLARPSLPVGGRGRVKGGREDFWIAIALKKYFFSWLHFCRPACFALNSNRGRL